MICARDVGFKSGWGKSDNGGGTVEIPLARRGVARRRPKNFRPSRCGESGGGG